MAEKILSAGDAGVRRQGPVSSAAVPTSATSPGRILRCQNSRAALHRAGRGGTSQRKGTDERRHAAAQSVYPGRPTTLATPIRIGGQRRCDRDLSPIGDAAPGSDVAGDFPNAAGAKLSFGNAGPAGLGARPRCQARQEIQRRGDGRSRIARFRRPWRDQRRAHGGLVLPDEAEQRGLLDSRRPAASVNDGPAAADPRRWGIGCLRHGPHNGQEG